MSDRAEEPDDDESSEWRMRRARAAIDHSFEELVKRVEEQVGAVTSTGPAEVGVDRVASRGLQPGTGLDAALERRVAEAAESIDRRVGEMVSVRVRRAERRLELQAQALEAALGEEAVQARLAAEQIEQARSALAAASATALRELQDAVDGMKELAAREQAEPTAMAVDEAAAPLADRSESELEAEVARLQTALEAVRAELSRRSIKRLEEAVGSALERRTAALERRLETFTERNAELAEGRVRVAFEAAEARIAAAERAQQREESVRRRTEAARAEAESRVRAAERRLVDVLARLERADRDPIRPARLED